MAEIRKLESWPVEVGRDELVQYFTLTSEDVAWVNKSARGTSAKLGLAVQLCALPWLGFVPEDVPAAPPAAVSRLAVQLGLPVGALASYGSRAQTRTDHLKLSAKRLGWASAEADERTGWKRLREFLVERALEHDVPSVLFRLATQWLASDEVCMLRPGVVALMREIATARGDADGELFRLVGPILAANPALSDELDGLLVVDPYLGRTPLAWLCTGSDAGQPGGGQGRVGEAGLPAALDAHTLDLSVLPAERRRFLAGVGRRSTAQALQRREPERRYPILLTLSRSPRSTCWTRCCCCSTRRLSAREAAARAKMTEALAERAKGGENRQQLLDEILTIVLDPAVTDDAVGSLLRERVGMDRMRAAWAARQQRLPRDHGHLSMLDASMPYLRQFAPAVLAAVQFAGGAGTDELLQAVSILAGLYATGARKVPAGAPVGFVPTKWAGYLAAAAEAGDVTAYRHYWELCVLVGLRDGLRSGDVFVPGLAPVRRSGVVPAHARGVGAAAGGVLRAWSASPRPRLTRSRRPTTSCTPPWLTGDAAGEGRRHGAGPAH